MKSKNYFVNLNVSEQGNDMDFYLEQTAGDVAKAFSLLSDNYKKAADICRKMSGVASEYDIKICIPDNHIIDVIGPDSVLETLEKDGFLDSFEYEGWDENCDDYVGEDWDLNDDPEESMD